MFSGGEDMKPTVIIDNIVFHQHIFDKSPCTEKLCDGVCFMIGEIRKDDKNIGYVHSHLEANTGFFQATLYVILKTSDSSTKQVGPYNTLQELFENLISFLYSNIKSEVDSNSVMLNWNIGLDKAEKTSESISLQLKNLGIIGYTRL